MKLNKTVCFVYMFSLLITTGCATTNPDLTVIHQEAYQAYQAEDYPAAAEKFEILVSEMPNDAELWFRLGNSYAKSMMPQPAIEAYQNSLIRDPHLTKAWYNMGIIQMQIALKSFTDMQSYVQIDDPVGIRGKQMRDGLADLLGPDEKSEEQK